jgi:Ser/Thr protein kinase RdoA (MazF antagonist)
MTTAESRLFDAALQSVDAATGDLPIVWQHADFGPWNIYRDGDDVSVIDWEIARRGPALADLLYFVSHWSAAVRGCQSAHERVRHFESLFCGTMPADPMGRAVYGELLDYMRALGVPARIFPHILLYMVAEQAVDRARRLEQMGRPASRDVAANEYVGEMDVLARHARRLFHGARAREVLRAAS